MAVSDTRSITDLSACEIASLIRSHKLSAVDTVEAHIRRIEAVNASLNALVVPLFDQARAAAVAADQSRHEGEPLGPLHGLPITIKEQYRVLGTQTTLGILRHVGDRAKAEGPLVTRLRQAGAIILGKTNVSQTLIYHESDNPVYGRTNNPWSLERTPGGSSGGETAIVAAGGSSLGLAGDLGGSIRVPAHFCGIHGLKPTARRLTNDDLPVHLFAGGQEAIVAQPGPVARFVADLDLMMGVLAAPSTGWTSEVIPPIPWPDFRGVSVPSLRVGMYVDDGFFLASPAIRRAVREAAAMLKDMGAKVEEFVPPAVHEAVHLFLAIASSDGGAWLKHMLGRDRPDTRVKGLLDAGRIPETVRPLIASMVGHTGQRRLAFAMRSIRRKSAREYWQTIEELNIYRARFIATMDAARLDVLICPPHALPALTHGSGEHLTVYSGASYAALYNVLGMPAGVVAATRVKEGEESDRPVSKDPVDQAAARVERGSAGLPVGVQVVARHWREDVVLAVMAALEEQFRARPDYPRSPMSVLQAGCS